ncbi:MULTISPECIES: hypothetical protein [Fischerella]|uniref:Uncharacterized protein n=1 Tax=Fischerella muscicola CCMEE 5323 TaxID=2019572 RepID=A0A2N6K3E4_FISMU|nr:MULTISPECIES: hypothetical protein [Fischerella]MBD2433227.1 hypothetical protein [Fischerella sp. FACHB-380]PLZ90041.1 hypothetical protein CEN44_11760 [Fischerella muscicola CCMEE 5323]
MAFIKIDKIVVNTNYIAAIRLEGLNRSEEESVSLLIAIPSASLFQEDSISSNLYHYEWIEFTGDAAKALRDYFTSFNNVIDLLPLYH